MNNQKPVNSNRENKELKCPAKENNAKSKITKQQKSGLYSALAVCLVSVAAAALVTYMGFNGSESETSLTVTGISESVLSEVNDNDDPLKDGERKDEPTVEKAESEAEEPSEKSENLLSDHEGEPDTEETEKTAENEADAEPEKDNNIITELIKETAASETYETIGTVLPPLENLEISKNYSSDLIYSETMKDYRSHNGIDFISSEGSEVKSVSGGKVKDVYEDLLLGNVVEAEHGEYLVRYCGLGDGVKVRPGDVLSAGTTIGTVGEIPFEKSEGTHLHIEVKKDGLYIDPNEIIK